MSFFFVFFPSCFLQSPCAAARSRASVECKEREDTCVPYATIKQRRSRWNRAWRMRIHPQLQRIAAYPGAELVCPSVLPVRFKQIRLSCAHWLCLHSLFANSPCFRRKPRAYAGVARPSAKHDFVGQCVVVHKPLASILALLSQLVRLFCCPKHTNVAVNLTLHVNHAGGVLDYGRPLASNCAGK